MSHRVAKSLCYTVLYRVRVSDRTIKQSLGGVMVRVVASTSLSGNEPYKQVGAGRVVTLGVHGTRRHGRLRSAPVYRFERSGFEPAGSKPARVKPMI